MISNIGSRLTQIEYVPLVQPVKRKRFRGILIRREPKKMNIIQRALLCVWTWLWQTTVNLLLGIVLIYLFWIATKLIL